MESIQIIGLLFVAGILLLFVFFRSSFPHLPGPSARAYLPGGEVFPALKDNRFLSRTLLDLRKKYGEVFQMWLGPVDTVVTSNPADVAQLLGAIDFFGRPKALRVALETVSAGSLFTMPQKVHAVARRHLRNEFNYSFLESFHPHMMEAVGELSSVLRTAAQTSGPPEVVDIREVLGITTFRVLTNVAFGCNLNRKELQSFVESTSEFMHEMLLEIVGYPLRQALTVFGIRKGLFESKRKMDNFCRSFIERRLKETAQEKKTRSLDVLDAILSLEDHDLTALTSEVLVFAIAGSHTNLETICWSLYSTCCNSEIVKKIHKEIDSVVGDRPLDYEDINRLPYLKCVWQETLRMYPPGAFIGRTALKDVTLAGTNTRIGKGAQVLSFVKGAHMNSAAWSEPETFMPERWGAKMREGERAPPGANIAFSIGQRACAGRFLADYEGILILAEIHRQFELTLACKPEEVECTSGYVESARTCIDGSDFGFGVPVHVGCR